MRTIILAAGLGKRIRLLTKNKPKCLLEIEGKTLIERTLNSCAISNLKEVVIVTGYAADKVEYEVQTILSRSKLDLDVEYIYNSEYAKKNNCYSLLVGLPEHEEDIVIINSDDVFDSRILNGISQSSCTSLVIDNVKVLTEESMKVHVDDGKINKIGKWLDINSSFGEYIGIAYISSKDFDCLKQELLNIVETNPQGFYEHAFDEMFSKTLISYFNTDGLKWTEVDNVDDFKFACDLVKKDLLK
ncbi:MAG: phosphocholine cytidylyltransferase family protein [Planctomycetota bacterium]|jgi:choline kinase